MADVFLSYKKEDKARAQQIADGLKAEGFDVWWDPRLNAGETYDEVIERHLRAARCAVVLWSPRSRESRWVRAEATVAMNRDALVPIMIEACEPPIAFTLVQTADLTAWNGNRADETWQAFVGDLREKLAAAPAAVAAPAPTAADMEDAFWKTLDDGGDWNDYDSYLRRFPNGKYAAEARTRRAALPRPRRTSPVMLAAVAVLVVAVAGIGGYLVWSEMQPEPAVAATTLPSPQAPAVRQLRAADFAGDWVDEGYGCDVAERRWHIDIETGGALSATLAWIGGDGRINRERVVEMMPDGALKVVGKPDGVTEQYYFYRWAGEDRIEAAFNDGATQPWAYVRCPVAP